MRFFVGLVAVFAISGVGHAQDATVASDDIAIVSDVVVDTAVAPEDVVVDATLSEDVADVVAPTVAPVAPVAPTTVAPPTTDSEAIGMIGDLVASAKAGKWFVTLGFALMLLMYGFRRFGLEAKVGAKALPWVNLGLGVVLAFAVAVASGVAVLEALWIGFVTSAAASLLWSALFKHLVNKDPVPPVK